MPFLHAPALYDLVCVCVCVTERVCLSSARARACVCVLLCACVREYEGVFELSARAHVCVCVHVYACVWVGVYVHIFVVSSILSDISNRCSKNGTHAHASLVRLCVCEREGASVCVRKCVCASVCVYVYACVCMCVHLYVYVCVRESVCARIHKNTQRLAERQLDARRMPCPCRSSFSAKEPCNQRLFCRKRPAT